ncbi:MAG: DUF1304 domain-containing protein [Flavobacteriales bacterium]
MHIITQILLAIVAIEHLFFLYMEMFAWTTLGRKAFGKALPHHLFEPTKALAANQGLYNGFLAAGLVWSLLITDYEWAISVALFFTGCVLVAAIYGGLSASKKILVIQGIPAAIAMLALLLLENRLA